MSRNLSRHSGVSCDVCGISGFSGKRYKCLICYDFDLCVDCYEAGETGSGRHSTLHPMQCILTKVDSDLFYGGESHGEQPQSFTCSLCGLTGLSESQLREHITKQHNDSSAAQEVICPVCAAHPSGDPNHVTDDLLTHLTMEHRAAKEIDLEPNTVQSRVRRLIGRRRGGGGGDRSCYIGTFREPSMQSQHDSVDPISELLSQLSGPSSGGGGGSGDTVPLGRRREVPPQIQQLLEHHERQGLERASPSRRPIYRKVLASGGSGLPPVGSAGPSHRIEPMDYSQLVLKEPTNTKTDKTLKKDNYLLSRLEPQQTSEDEEDRRQFKADKSLFIRELLFSTLVTSSPSSSPPSVSSDSCSEPSDSEEQKS